MCNAVASQSPTFSWQVDGVGIQSGSHHGVRFRNGGKILVMNNANESHTGNYTCIATNNGGSVNRTSRIDVSPCRPSSRMAEVPVCAYTILFVEESNTINGVKAILPNLTLELDRSLLANGIGIRKGNYFSVIGFGTNVKSRMIRSGSRVIFSVHRVREALDQLSSSAITRDGLYAMYSALADRRLKSKLVQHCAIHMLLVTNGSKVAVADFPEKKFHRRLCQHQPLITNAILDIGLRVQTEGSEVSALGIDWRGYPYVQSPRENGEQQERLSTFDTSFISPATVSACREFTHYGLLPLQTTGSLWDMRSSLSLAKRRSMISAMTNVTVTALKDFKPCLACRCHERKSGKIVKLCYPDNKDDRICNCKSNTNVSTRL